MSNTPEAPELPLDRLTAYLTNAGWSMLDEDERTTLWAPIREAMPADPQSAEVRIVLPTREQVVDYGERVQQAVRALSFVERRVLREIVEDISLGGADWVSVRLTPKTPSGEAPLAMAQAAVTALRNYVIGAASSLDVDSTTLVLPPRRPARAESYARDARLSTASGSFVLNLALPLRDGAASDDETGQAPPADDPSRIDVPIVDITPPPYGRRVTTRMATVAVRATQLAQEVGDGEASLEDFGRPDRSVGNATELAALAALGAGEEAQSRYFLRFGYSPLAPQSRAPNPARPLAVTPSQQRVLEEAADFLRTRQPRAGVVVSGLVVRLARDGNYGPGDVVIEGVDDDSGARRRFRMNVAEDDYAQAIHAHEQGLQVVVRGDLQTRGLQRYLRNIRSFEVVSSIAPF